MVTARRRKQPSAEPAEDPKPKEDPRFHIPTRNLCICQFCRRTWPCPDAEVKECDQ